jgi:hypothetical protein
LLVTNKENLWNYEECLKAIREAIEDTMTNFGASPCVSWDYSLDNARVGIAERPEDMPFDYTAYAIIALELDIARDEVVREILLRKLPAGYAGDRVEKAAARLSPQERERFLRDVARVKQEFKL